MKNEMPGFEIAKRSNARSTYKFVLAQDPEVLKLGVSFFGFRPFFYVLKG